MVLHMVHLVESLHRRDDLSARNLLVEGVDKAVGTCAVLKGHSEGVKLRIKSVGLRAEGETPRHAELGEKMR